MLSDLLSTVDARRRVFGRNLSDMANNPSDFFQMAADNAPQTVQEYVNDPMNFVGGGLGRIKALGKAGKELGGTYPTHASMVGNMRSLNLINDAEANRIINLGKGEAKTVDPELLGLIEDEIVRRGVQRRRPLNDLMDVMKD